MSLEGQIAAICRARGAALATRSVADFDKTGVEVINPWHPGNGTEPGQK